MLLTGLQRSRGVELTAAGRLQGNWYLRGGLGLQNASIVEDNNRLAGNRYADNANTAVLPGYARWDALVGYRTGQWDWRRCAT